MGTSTSPTHLTSLFTYFNQIHFTLLMFAFYDHFIIWLFDVNIDRIDNINFMLVIKPWAKNKHWVIWALSVVWSRGKAAAVIISPRLAAGPVMTPYDDTSWRDVMICVNFYSRIHFSSLLSIKALKISLMFLRAAGEAQCAVFNASVATIVQPPPDPWSRPWPHPECRMSRVLLRAAISHWEKIDSQTGEL